MYSSPRSPMQASPITSLISFVAKGSCLHLTVLLVSFNQEQGLSLFVFMNLMFLKIIGHQFCRMFLEQIRLMFLHDQTQVLDLRQERHRSDAVLFSLHPIWQHTVLICPITGGLNFDHQIKILNTGSLCSNFFFLIFALLIMNVFRRNI